MSEHIQASIEDGVRLSPSPVVPGSLEDRVAKRRREIESRNTELFDVPGFEGVFKVELQLVGGKRQFQLAQKNEHIHDEYQRGLRTAADIILAATVGFHAVVDDEDHTQPAEGTSWKKLAKAFDEHLDDTLPGRVALLRLIGEEGLSTLAADWKKWCRTRGVQVERELEDFS